MNELPVRSIARLVTRCGCSRELTQAPPFPPVLRVPLTIDVASLLRLDDGSLLELFADEGTHRTFTLEAVNRERADLVVGIYREKGRTSRGN